MKANNLSICLPSACNKNCPYCVSNMTGDSHVNVANFYKNIHKAKTVAQNAQVSSVIITGKGEPLLYPDHIQTINRVFAYFPLEIQTNGILLSDNSIQTLLLESFINTIAVSIDNMQQMLDLKPILEIFHTKGFTIRITINLVNDILHHFSLKKIMTIISDMECIDQVSFRSVSIPSNPVDTPASMHAQKWINDIDYITEYTFLRTLNIILEEKGTVVQHLPFGATVYMVGNVSYTYFEYCVQDTNNNEDIRSLIYYSDGHMSTTWYGSNHGRIF